MRRIAFALIGFFAAFQSPVAAAPYTVTNANDSGPGSLRVAIQSANQSTNSNPALNRIEFDIPGTNVHTIFPFSALPALTNSITIDGYTQSGARSNTLPSGNDALLLIELNGTNAGGFTSGLQVFANNCTILGLVINHFAYEGIEIQADGNTIVGNFIGTDATGRLAAGNTNEGILVSGAGNMVGGSLPASRNVISGNGTAGVSLQRNNNRVQGNFIGTDLTGTVRLPNKVYGVKISGGDTNIIGGSIPGEGNLISGNDGDGISFENPENTPFGNVVQGNRVGTDVTGTMALSNAANGITLNGAQAALIGGQSSGTGNVISGNGQDGVQIVGGQENVVQGNFIGTDKTGANALGNFGDGINVINAGLDLIGGASPGARNLISGNVGDGVRIQFARSNLVQGNFIGTDVNGVRPLANGGSGLEVGSGDGNLVGGTSLGAGNLISGNGLDGITIYNSDGDSIYNVVQGNLIGTDLFGVRPLGNTGAGIRISASLFNTIGGAAVGGSNIISANGENGILLTDGSSVNVVSGNLIGVASDGRSPLGNQLNGILLTGSAENNLVGGALTDSGNIIAFNRLAGVRVGSSNDLSGFFTMRDAILGNSIFSNDGLGIDLGPIGPTSNDLGDGDAGPNGLQNFPVLTAAVTGTDTIVSGSLNSVSNSLFRIEFFAIPNADPSGFGEGERFIGFMNVTTDGAGNAAFSFTAPTLLPVGQWITATATGPDNSTSEFSAPRQVRFLNWVARYDGPSGYHDEGTAIAFDNTGNVYVTGLSYAYSDHAPDSDYATVKYNANGQQQWVARYDDGGFDGATAITVHGEGDVYVTGYSAAENGTYDYATIKYSINGDLLWVARYNGLGDGYDAAKAIQVGAAGDVYVTGYSYGATNFDYATVKYDANGGQLWVARYDGPAHGDDSASGLVLDAAGNAYVTGSSLAADGGVDYATVKYSPTGSEQWVARFHGPAPRSDNRATAVVIDRLGNVYVTGYSYGIGSSYDYATLKYSTNGAQAWLRRYDGPASYDDQAAALAVDALGNILVTGYSYGAGSSADYATIKYDPNGNQLWAARYDGLASGYDAATALAVDGTDDVFVTGFSFVSYTNSDRITITGSDYVTIKYDSSGVGIWTNGYNDAGNLSLNRAVALAVGPTGAAYVTGSSPGVESGQDYLTIKYLGAEDLQQQFIYTATVSSIPLNIENLGANVVLRWSNSDFGLQAGPAVTGPFTNVPGATSPYTNATASTPVFFRLKAN